MSEMIFDDIRPYRDTEIPSAMQRIVADPLFPVMAGYVFPDRTLDEVKEVMLATDSIESFQENFMKKALQRIIDTTTTGFTCSGIENIDASRPHIFISNHRDIVLDAALLQNALHDNGLPTTEVTFGSNLMKGNLVVEIGKSNRMFKVERPGGSPRAFYSASRHLSEYIYNAVAVRKQSIWIAQRNGRTKDGIDRTDPGIISMFLMGSGLPAIETLEHLSLQPVAISYEWEPCDFLKVTELAKKEAGPYVKAENEDFESIMTGLMQPKGSVHLHVCPEITGDDVRNLDHAVAAAFRSRVAELVDSRICPSYKLYPNNYVAHDLLTHTDTFSSFYSAGEKEAFVAHIGKHQGLEGVCDSGKLERRLLGIYANPVDSVNMYGK